MKTARFLLPVVAALGAAPAPAQAPSAVSDAIRAGQVGERYDGYMAPVGVPASELERQVAAINLLRRNLYIDLAAQRNVTARLVGLAAACELFARLGVGEAYMLEDGVWRRRMAGQPAPVSRYCR